MEKQAFRSETFDYITANKVGSKVRKHCVKTEETTPFKAPQIDKFPDFFRMTEN